MKENKADPKKNNGKNKGWDNLKPAKKGEVRNPKGRPKKEICIPDILRRLLSEPSDFSNNKETNLEVICRVAINQAQKGDKDARSWIADRTEGRAVERVLTQQVLDDIVIE